MEALNKAPAGTLPEAPPSEGFFVPNVYTEAEQQQDARLREKRTESASWTGVLDAAREQQWIGDMLLRQVGNEDLADDPDFQLDDEKLKRYTQDLPLDYYDEFEDVRSEAQAMQLRESLLASQQRQQELMSKGAAAGIAASVGASLVDPVALGVSLGTEGMLAPFIYASKASRLERAVKAGLVGAAATAPVEGYLASQDPDYDLSDAVFGTVLGGGIAAGVRYKWPGDLPVDQALNKAAAELQVDDLRRAGALPGPRTALLLPNAVTPEGKLKTPEDFARDAEGWFTDPTRNSSTTFGAKIRGDRAADVFSSASEYVRKLGHALFDDPNTTKGAFQGETASLFAQREFDSALRRRVLQADSLLKEYRKEMRAAGKKPSDQDFDEAVSRVLRGGSSDSAAVNKMAAFDRTERDRIAKMANEPGQGVPVRGAEDMTLENYLNRRYSLAKIEAKIAKTSYAEVRQALAKAIRGYDAATADKVAGHVLDVARQSRSGTLDFNLLGQPKETVAALLEREHGLKNAEAWKIAQSLERLTQGSDAGRAGNLKHRIDLDELAIEDLLENSSSGLFSSYARSMYGHIALARQGIDSESTFLDLLNKASQDLNKTPVTGQGAQWKRDRELKNLRDAYDHIVGRSVGDSPSAQSATIGRLMRKWNFARVMNVMGLSALGDLGSVLSHAGLKATLRHVPELAAIHRRMRDGKFIDELSEETAELTGWLNRATVHSAQERVQEFGAGGTLKEGGWSRVERGMDFAGRVTSTISGMNHMLDLTQRLAGKAMIQTFLDAARTGKPHVLGTARLAEMGVDEALMAAIKREMMKKGGASWDGSGRIKKLNIDGWDYETRLKFGNVLRRWGSYLVQEQHFGSLPGWMDTTGGKILGQFRTFQMGAWAKQTTYQLKHRDLRAGAAFLTSTLTGVLSYLAYVQATSIGREDRNRYVREMTEDWKDIALRGFMRGGISSFIPGMVDTTAAAAGEDPLFGFRTSGLSSNLILGIPSVDSALKFTDAWSEAVELIRGDRATEETVRGISSAFLWQNALGIRTFIYNLAKSLPRDRD